MHTVPVFLVGAGVCAASTAWAGGLPSKTVYVDCEGAPGGSGSYAAPYDSITAAVPAARALSATHAVTIDVADGICTAETFPIVLDFAVHVRGKRIPRYDGELFPIDGQYRDTLVTWPALPAPLPAGTTLFAITGDGVRISRISVDGKQVPLPDNAAQPGPSFPIAFAARGAPSFAIEHVRVTGVAVPVVAAASSGVVAGSFLRGNAEGLVTFGGDAAAPPTVYVLGNRVDYRVNGIVAAGATTGLLPLGGPAGDSLELVMIRNDFVTTFTNTGPTNPNAFRLSPVADKLDGRLEAALLYNRVSGPAKYGITVHAGPQTRRSASDYTGVVEAVFLGTTLDAAATATARTLITFTGIRATALPCELDPSNVCPSGTNRWEYLGLASYELWHGGELDGAWIDHPEIEPVDGRVLDNVLVINDEVIDYETFVVVP